MDGQSQDIPLAYAISKSDIIMITLSLRIVVLAAIFITFVRVLPNDCLMLSAVPVKD